MRLRPDLALALVAALAGRGAGPPAPKPAAHAPAAAPHAPEAKPAKIETAGVHGEAAPKRAAAGLHLRVGQADKLTRLEFVGGGGQVVSQDAHSAVLRFAAPGRPDLSRITVEPVMRLTSTAVQRAGGALELTVTAADDAVVRIGRADGVLYVNLADAQAADPAHAAAPAAPATARPDPDPKSGLVTAGGVTAAGVSTLTFDWAAPAAAAVFRRGEAVWIVFDADSRLELAAQPLAKGLGAPRAIKGAGWTALRIPASATTTVGAVAAGPRWTVTLGRADAPSAPVALAREADGGRVLAAALAGASRAFSVADPVVGDTLAVVPALGPAKGLASRREFVDLVMLPSVQGLAAEPIADDLAVAVEGEHVRFGRPGGLALSSGAGGVARPAVPVALPQRASLPGLIDAPAWARTGQGGFLKRYADLQTEAAKGKEGRLALARFLVGSELAHEALGVLGVLRREDQTLLADGEYRALAGAAKVMIGRWKEAEADFAAPVLDGDPAAALWRGLIAQELGDPAKAREQFAVGARAAPLFAPALRLRFEQSLAEAALAQGDVPAARRALAAALAGPADSATKAELALLQARLLEQEGASPQALALYDQLSRNPHDGVAAPALLRAAELKLASGQLAPDAAAAVFDSLRWRWRGGATEVEAVRALGRVELAQGRYREALAALGSMGSMAPDTPQGLALNKELADAFRFLFLDGGADGLQPIQALGLFYDFRALTPIGADGDLMVRKLARRLIDVDLLPQAAELLKHQAMDRLDGVARAQVATDLALVYLMDGKPEDAIGAINGSRTTLLPTKMNAERRAIEARALVMLGRVDHALELLDSDSSPDAQDVKAEIAWRGKDWKAAGPALERAMGERWKSRAPLTPLDEDRLLRAGAAYSLAGDSAALARLKSRYGPLLAGAQSADALRVALAGTDDEIAFARPATNGADGFTAWVQAMKKRFRETPLTSLPAPTRQAAAEGATRAG